MTPCDVFSSFHLRRKSKHFCSLWVCRMTNNGNRALSSPEVGLMSSHLEPDCEVSSKSDTQVWEAHWNSAFVSPSLLLRNDGRAPVCTSHNETSGAHAVLRQGKTLENTHSSRNMWGNKMGEYIKGEFNTKLMDWIMQHFVAGLLPSAAAAQPKLSILSGIIWASG